MKNWVTPHLTGGLGNRLFQFAAAMGVSEKWKVPCIFHEKTTETNDHGPKDNIYKLYPSVSIVKQSDPWFIMPEKRGGFYEYEEFDEEMPFPRIMIDGWRQTAKYFPKEFDLTPCWEQFLTLKQVLDLQKKYGLETKESKLQTWFLHIRLGDYKILPHHQIHAIEYYNKTFQYIPKGSRLILFSDEIDNCKKWIEQKCKEYEFEFVPCEESEEISSLWLMSQCWGGAVVANSTFSWWGAYFARLAHPEKENYVALYPGNWGQGMPVAKDIIPEWGTRIEF